MISALKTDPGLVRGNNEDSVKSDDTLGIYLLADGMGGHNAGEVASDLAVDTVYAELSSAMAATATDSLPDLMTHALLRAHQEIHGRGGTDRALSGMGTTVVLAIVRGAVASIAHAGDSRCYHYSTSSQGRGVLKQVTTDHTLGHELLANGISRKQIQERLFHTLTRAVGCGEPPIPDFNRVALSPGDMLLLCSDGLTNMVTDAEIEAILSHGESPLETLTENLVEAANGHGGIDNISVILACYDS